MVILSVSDSDRRVPEELGQESQASSCLRKGTPLASRVAQGVSGPSTSCVWNPRVFADDARGWQCPFVLCLHPQACLRGTCGVFRTMHGGVSAASGCAFTHRVAFEEVLQARILEWVAIVFSSWPRKDVLKEPRVPHTARRGALDPLSNSRGQR